MLPNSPRARRERTPNSVDHASENDTFLSPASRGMVVKAGSLANASSAVLSETKKRTPGRKESCKTASWASVKTETLSPVEPKILAYWYCTPRSSSSQRVGCELAVSVTGTDTTSKLAAICWTASVAIQNQSPCPYQAPRLTPRSR